MRRDGQGQEPPNFALSVPGSLRVALRLSFYPPSSPSQPHTCPFELALAFSCQTDDMPRPSLDIQLEGVDERNASAS